MTPDEHLDIVKRALSERLDEVGRHWAFVVVAEMPNGDKRVLTQSRLRAPGKGAEMLAAIHEALGKIPAEHKPS